MPRTGPWVQPLPGFCLCLCHARMQSNAVSLLSQNSVSGVNPTFPACRSCPEAAPTSTSYYAVQWLPFRGVKAEPRRRTVPGPRPRSLSLDSADQGPSHCRPRTVIHLGTQHTQNLPRAQPFPKAPTQTNVGNPHQSWDRGALIFSHLPRRKLRHRQIKELGQGHRAG